MWGTSQIVNSFRTIFLFNVHSVGWTLNLLRRSAKMFFSLPCVLLSATSDCLMPIAIVSKFSCTTEESVCPLVCLCILLQLNCPSVSEHFCLLILEGNVVHVLITLLLPFLIHLCEVDSLFWTRYLEKSLFLLRWPPYPLLEASVVRVIDVFHGVMDLPLFRFSWFNHHFR